MASARASDCVSVGLLFLFPYRRIKGSSSTVASPRGLRGERMSSFGISNISSATGFDCELVVFFQGAPRNSCKDKSTRFKLESLLGLVVAMGVSINVKYKYYVCGTVPTNF